MKVPIVFKHPDVVDIAVEDLDKEQAAIVRKVAKEFVEDGEYVTIIIDTDTHGWTVEKPRRG